MSRFAAFQNLQHHPLIGKTYKKLTVEDIVFCRDFILKTDHMTDDDFCLRVSRMFTGDPVDVIPRGSIRPKNQIEIYALLSQSVKPNIRKRRSLNAYPSY